MGTCLGLRRRVEHLQSSDHLNKWKESREKKRRERGEKEQDIMEKEIASRHLFCHSRYTHIPAFGVLWESIPTHIFDFWDTHGTGRYDSRYTFLETGRIGCT